jgi:hypothetical protein
MDAVALLMGSLFVVGITYARIDLAPGNWPWGLADEAQAVGEFWLKALELTRPIPELAYLLTAVAFAALVWSIVVAARRHDTTSLTILVTGAASLATLVVLRSTLISVWPFPRSLILFVPLLSFPIFFVLSAPRDRLRPVGTIIGIAMVASLVFWTATQWNATYFPVWHDNAGVPNAVTTIQEEIRDDGRALRLAHPWPLDAPLLYLFERRGLDGWELVAADDATADYRILRAGEIASDAGPIIYTDLATDVRVQRLGGANGR